MSTQREFLPHIHFIELEPHSGEEHMCVLVKHDKVSGDRYIIQVKDLDNIDERRIVDILRKRDSKRLPLWEVLSNETLRNGMNALEYFHQYVKVLTQNGRIVNPDSTRRGKTVTTRRVARPAPQAQQDGTQAPQDSTKEETSQQKTPAKKTSPRGRKTSSSK